MTRQLLRKSKAETEPLYGLIWRRLKHFPKGLADGSAKPPIVSGPAAAALISTGIGPLLMMVSHHLADTSKERENIIWVIGSWIPGSHNPNKMWGDIGPYAGKETILLLGWLVSWAILHRLWRHRNIKPKTMFFWFFALLIVTTIMSWPPLFPYLPLM